MKDKSVIVVIVTYNRLLYLKKELLALGNQSFPVTAILILDNNSTDGTTDYLCELLGITIDPSASNGLQKFTKEYENISFYYLHNGINEGGAGGFARAIQEAETLPYDFMWIMDDDVEPERECLENLFKYVSPNSLACVPYRYGDGFTDQVCIHYDLSHLRYFAGDSCQTTISPDSITEEYVVTRKMPFEGPLISMVCARKVGIPDKNYFILFDDTDYAYRLSTVTTIRYIPSARLHRMIPFENNNKGFSWKDYYYIRNTFLFEKKYGDNIAVKYIRPFLRMLIQFGGAVRQRRFQCAKWIWRAFLDGSSGKNGKTVEPGAFFDL